MVTNSLENHTGVNLTFFIDAYIYIIIIVRYGREFNQLKRENKLDWQVSLLFSCPWFMNKTEVLV